MNCLNEGTLRARLDEELEPLESQEVDQHLGVCATCRKRSAAIEKQSGEVSRLLTAKATTVDPVLAYSRYLQSAARRGEPKRAWTELWREAWLGGWKRPAWAGMAAVCVLVGLLSFAPAKSWGQRILEMLRVQKVAVVPVDLSALSQLGRDQPARQLTQLISDSVIVTMKPGQPTVAANLDAAAEMAGFHIRGLDELGAPAKILVNGEAAFHMTLNRDRIEAVLNAVGRSDIQVPQSVDGSTVAVHIPKMASLSYGECKGVGQNRNQTGNCLTFFQVPSPTVSVPPGLNIAALAEAGLQVFGMDASEAQAFSQTVDWSSTLVISVPETGGSSRPVPVDGVDGTLVEVAAGGKAPARYSLVWVKSGMVYEIHGQGDANQALTAAGSLN
jgi:anti-sigma factor RsiW